MGYQLTPTAQYESSVGGLIPFSNPEMRNMSNVQQRQFQFDPSAYNVQLGQGVQAIPGQEGWQFIKEAPDAQNAQTFYTGNFVDNESSIRGIRTDALGNPFEKGYFSNYGTQYNPSLLSGGGITRSGSGAFGNIGGDARQQFLQQEYQNIMASGDVSPSSAWSVAAFNLNKLTGNQSTNQANLSASQDFIRQQRKKDNSFGNALKRFGGVALPVLALPAGAALAGAFAPAATGVAAGGAATGSTLGTLGSTLASSFSVPTALSSAITSGLGTLATGGDFGDALKGAALGGFGGGFGASLGNAAGLGTVGQTALTRGLVGAAPGIATGDTRNALIGGVLGAGSGYLSAGGNVPGLGSMQQQLPADVYGAPKPGTGILGKVGDLTQSTGSGLTIGGQPMKLGSLLGAAGDVYGYVQGKSDIDDIQQMLAQQSAQAQAQFEPYAQAGQNALANLEGGYDAFTQDPGYQFRLEQGNQALERSLAARGLGQSGAALKAAQEYGQGLASQSYGDFFNRQSSLAGQGLGAASGLGSLYTNLGNVQAAAQLQQMNDRNKLLSSLGGRFGEIFG